MKLLQKRVYTGTITLLSGLHIGGANTSLNIGGIDNFVVRDPITQEQYIPGSSLKGKMRSLIELKYGEAKNGNPTNNVNTKAGALFGVAANIKKKKEEQARGDKKNPKGVAANTPNNTEDCHPSRIIVRDAKLINKEELAKTDVQYIETKAEVNINRITGKPISGVRYTERVPAGAKFSLNFILNVFENEDEKALEKTLKESLILLENDYLGGSGSRGYGHVKFGDLKKDGNPFSLQ